MNSADSAGSWVLTMIDSLSSGLTFISRILSALTIDPLLSSGKYVMFFGVEQELSSSVAAASPDVMSFKRIFLIDFVIFLCVLMFSGA